MAVPPQIPVLLRRTPKGKKKHTKEFHSSAAQKSEEEVSEAVDAHENPVLQQTLLKRRSKGRNGTKKLKLVDPSSSQSCQTYDRRHSPQPDNSGLWAETQRENNQMSADEREDQDHIEDERDLFSKKNAKRGGKKQAQAPLSRKAKRKANNGNLESFGETRLPVETRRTLPIVIQPNQNGPLRGMGKWLADYHSKRPGFHVLRQQIDGFVADFEATEEKERKEREIAAAEEGWTVVEHHKGRKKTADLESGIKVGGVALAAAEKSLKKGKKEMALNFYRFQRREARRNEVLELQQRFEEDKKKVAALRAARRFRPY